MRAFVGQTRSRKLLVRLTELGFGEMCVREEYPPRRSPWVLDNGAFKDWRSGQAFDATAFEFVLRRFSMTSRYTRPEFVVIPDVVADASATLALAREWIPKINEILYGEVPLAFVVQDGMVEADVEPLLPHLDWIFVGGTVKWKWLTAARWCAMAHAHGKRCHIGRVGTPALVARARESGADSIDSAFPLWSTEHLDAFVAALRGEHTARQLDLFAPRGNPRPIPMDKGSLHQLAAGLEQVLAGESGQAPLGRQVLYRTETALRDVRGAYKAVKVQLQAMPSESGSFITSGGYGRNTLVVNVNGSVPAARLARAAAAGTLAPRIYEALIHEATHAADVFARGIVPDPGQDLEGYANEPREVRAYLQEVVDEVVTRGHAPELLHVFGPSKGLQYALQTSPTWERLSPLWTEANRRRVIRAVAQAVGGAT